LRRAILASSSNAVVFPEPCGPHEPEPGLQGDRPWTEAPPRPQPPDARRRRFRR
jgi:hypothetical protein